MKKILLFVGSFLFAINMSGQSELAKDYPTVEKMLKDVDFNFPKEGRNSKNGGGYSASLKLMKQPPKKVALVSFLTFDPGLTKSYTVQSTSTSGYIQTTYYTTYLKTKGVSKGNASLILDALYFSSIDTLISIFKEAGMELMLPDQFLDTDAKTKYYESFVVEHDKGNAWLKNVGSEDHSALYSYPAGYRVVDIIYEPWENYSKHGMIGTMDYKRNIPDQQTMTLSFDDKKMMQSVGYDLADALGVDAVLVVYFTIYSPKETRIMLQNANMIMLGKNPLQLGEGDKKPMFYRKGQFYCATRFQPDVQIYNLSKKDPNSAYINNAGFQNMVIALSKKMCNYLKGLDD